MFDEPVVDFPVGPNAAGVKIAGTATDLRYLVEGSKDMYRLTILEVGGDGSIGISVPEGVCADLFGNINYASTSDDASVHYDGTRPQVIVQSAQAGVVNNATIEIALVFSEPVYDLKDGTLSMLENATVTRTAGNGGDVRYTFDVTPLRDGIIALQVPEDAAFDAVGNGSAASEVFSLIVDSTGPTVQLSSFETPAEANARLVRVQATFSEPVTGFDQGDIAVSSGRLQNFIAREGGRNFVFDVRPEKGPVALHIPAGVATDNIGNPNRASEVFQREFDAARPAVEIHVAPEGLYRGDPIPVEVRFSEPVLGFSADILNVSGATATLRGGGEGASSYRFDVLPSGSGKVQLSIPAGAVRDAAGNGNRPARAQFTPPARRPAPLPADEEPGATAPPLIAN